MQQRFGSSGSGASDEDREGLVTAVDPVKGTITLGSTTCWTGGATLFVKSGAPATFSAVAVGATVGIHALSTKTHADGQAYATLVVANGG